MKIVVIPAKAGLSGKKKPARAPRFHGGDASFDTNPAVDIFFQQSGRAVDRKLTIALLPTIKQATQNNEYRYEKHRHL
jgi:hypothetical protein